MGLAVLPARLKDEMADLEQAILDGADIRADEKLAKHADWVEEFLPKYGFTAGSGLEGEITPERLHEMVQTEIGLVFKEVLTDAGVYKCTEVGRAAFMRFVDTVKNHRRRIYVSIEIERGKERITGRGFFPRKLSVLFFNSR